MKMVRLFETVTGTLIAGLIPFGMFYAFAQQPGGLQTVTSTGYIFWSLAVVSGILGMIGSFSERTNLIWLAAGILTALGLVGFFSVSVFFVPAALALALLARVMDRRKSKAHRLNV